MYITELSIKRPVVAIVFSMILVVFGLFVFNKLPVRELPAGLQPPVIQIQVDYSGASADVISSEITEIIIEDDGRGYPRDVLPKIGESSSSGFKLKRLRIILHLSTWLDKSSISLSISF